MSETITGDHSPPPNPGGRYLKLTRLLAALFAFALVASACGSDSDSAGGSDAASEENTSDSVDESSDAGDSEASPGSADETDAADNEPDEAEGRFAPQPLAEPATLTISLPIRVEPFTHFLLAESLGEFEKENLTVKFEALPSSDAIALLAAGKIDAIPTSFNAGAINAIGSGVEMRAVMDLGGSPAESQGIWVLNEVFEEGPAALKGEDVGSAIGPGSIGSLFLHEWLETGGLTIADINFVRFPAADIPQAMENGALKAAFVTSPGYLKIEDIATWVAGPPPEFSGGAVWFGPTVRTDNPEVGEAFIRAVLRTVDTHLLGDYKANPDTVELLAVALDTDADVISATPSLVWDNLENGIVGDVVNGLQDTWFLEPDVLKIDEPLPLDQILDLSLLERVAAAG